MGVTLAALHLKCDGRFDLLDQVVGAFRHVGWVPAEAGADEALLRQVAVSSTADGAFATIVISGQDRLDDGTLKELAVAFSRANGMPAVVTEINDSDAFDVLLFHSGQQIDALGCAATEPANGLRQLSADMRAKVWSQVFDRMLGTAPNITGVAYAEEAVELILSWIGLDPETGLFPYDEAVARIGGSHDTFLLSFVPVPRSVVSGGQRHGDSPPILTVFHDDDDCPHHRVYPAHWPLAAEKASGLKWLIVSSGAGFDGARIQVRVDDLSGGTIRLTGLTMQAFPFFNGQIMSPTPVATYEAALSLTLEEGVWTHDAPSFEMPDLDPEAAKRLIIILRLECIAEKGARARLRPEFLPLVPDAEPLDLPPVRIVCGHIDWRPGGSISCPNSEMYTERLLLELNTPSVLSLLTIMDGDTEELRSSARQAAESWLGSLSPSLDCTAAVLTNKHMTASGSVTKKRMELPLRDLTGDRAWKRWFSGKTDLQTLRIELRPEGSFQPFAGFVMQAALRDVSLTSELSAAWDAALHVAFWAVDHPEAWTTLGTDRANWLERFEGWIEDSDILQAHRIGAAWMPGFDTYDDFEQTIYEDLSGVDWFRRNLKGKLMTKSWCNETLRFVAPRTWLCDSLVDRLSVSPSALDGVAAISRIGRVTRFSLYENGSIEELERALSPVLPAAR